MVENLATFYGEKICEIDDVSYHAFPTVEALAKVGVEEKLRKNGYGYRAKYISSSAQTIVSKGGDKWLNSLKEMDYESAKKELMSLMGIGAKVCKCQYLKKIKLVAFCVTLLKSLCLQLQAKKTVLYTYLCGSIVHGLLLLPAIFENALKK